MKVFSVARCLAILGEVFVLAGFSRTASAQGAPNGGASRQLLAPSPASDSAPVTLVVDLAAGGPLDRERLREAIARELGRPVRWQRGSVGGTLVVRQEGPHIVVSFDGPDGRHDGRAILLPSDSAQAEEDIALLAVNVAKDQVSEFVQRVEPSSVPPAPPSARSAPPSRGACDMDAPRLPIAADLAPWVGVSTVDHARSVRNLSLGLLGAYSGGIEGLAVSGLVDIDRDAMCGVQVAGIVNVARALHGVQLAGLVNVTPDDSSGAQIGTVNVSGGQIQGAQIGVVNYAKDADFQLGLLNINASGRLLIDAWTKPETGLVLAGVKHGGAHYHWIYALGARPVDTERPWAAIGLGAHITPAERLYLDIDLIDQLELVFESDKTTQLVEARTVVGYRLVPALSLFAGPTFNVLAQGHDVRSGAPGYAADLTDTSSKSYRTWPGVSLGVEAL